MQSVAIIVMSVLTCVSYGIIHDQITARICVEYFTIGHQPISDFAIDDPTILGLIWGVIATWWVGVLLGVPLAFVSRFGPGPKRTVSFLVPRMMKLALLAFILAILSGLVGYVAASLGWIHLTGRMAVEVPPEKHVAFLVDLWAHNASYATGFLGGLDLCVNVWRQRATSVSHGDVS